MCGICGFTGAQPTDANTLKAMCDVMAHRGPDGEGRYLSDGIALGHRRLSLIDLTGGNQPMVRTTGEHTAQVLSPEQSSHGISCETSSTTLDTGDYAIVFNGEIYNFRELRSELESDGWHFTTNSDTEVLLIGYLAWGENVLERVRGMFAFAIWNRINKSLFCARDFFGIKPFYYALIKGVRGQQFVFASEIKSILEHPAYTRELNEEALEYYLMFQFSVLPETFFKGIFKLAPAHCMTVHADGSLEIRRYWQPTYAFDANRSFEATVELIDATMRESVRYHNVADVEVGSFLSSGIDSSYLAACLAQENPRIRTFTVGFAEYKGERDEISWASELANMLGIANTNKHISEAEYWDALPSVQWHMDEPSADPSAVALYFVDMLAAREVKAVLSGEGADELFGGYRIYQTPLAGAKLAWVPHRLLQTAAKLMRTVGLRGANYLERASQTVKDWYYTNANGVAFMPSEVKHLLKHIPTGGTPQQLTAPIYAEASKAELDETTRMQYLDLFFWLVGDILLKTDKMSMAHSLESRVPFLDKEVFRISATIPTHMRVSDSQTKRALRMAAEHVIPHAWAQKEKLGFPVPVATWLRKEHYYEMLKAWFSGETAQRFFHTDKLMRLLDEHKTGADRSRKIWIIFMFLMWYHIYFVEQQRPQRPSLNT